MKNLVASILEDGIISAEEVSKLKKLIYADGEVNEEEMDILFQLNDGAEKYCPEFTSLFISAIADGVLMDDQCIDNEEGLYLVEKIGDDIDSNEAALLNHLNEEADSIESEELLAMIDSL